MRGPEFGQATPATIMVFCELIADILPAGVLNMVNGFGLEAGIGPCGVHFAYNTFSSILIEFSQDTEAGQF